MPVCVCVCVPYPPSATSPKAVFFPAGGQACTAQETQTYWVGPGLTGCRSTGARARSGQAEWEHSGSDE